MKEVANPQPEELESAYRAFINDKGDYYAPKFMRFEQGGSKISWNWAVCFVTFFWLLYRRMNLMAVGYLILFPLIIGVIYQIGSAFIPQYWFIPGLLVWILFPPMFANAIYWSHAKRKVEPILAQGNNDEFTKLQAKGGTSTFAISIMAWILILLVVLFGALAIKDYFNSRTAEVQQSR